MDWRRSGRSVEDIGTFQGRRRDGAHGCPHGYGAGRARAGIRAQLQRVHCVQAAAGEDAIPAEGPIQLSLGLLGINIDVFVCLCLWGRIPDIYVFINGSIDGLLFWFKYTLCVH